MRKCEIVFEIAHICINNLDVPTQRNLFYTNGGYGQEYCVMLVRYHIPDMTYMYIAARNAFKSNQSFVWNAEIGLHMLYTYMYHNVRNVHR